MNATQSSDNNFIFHSNFVHYLYILAGGLMCRGSAPVTALSSIMRERDPELEEVSERQTCVSCVAHCFDLPCRLQDLKYAASNRMLQMVKVPPQESKTLLGTDRMRLKNHFWFRALCFAFKNTKSYLQQLATKATRERTNSQPVRGIISNCLGSRLCYIFVAFESLWTLNFPYFCIITETLTVKTQISLL